MTTRIQDFNSEYPNPLPGRVLRGGKGIVARTHKMIMYVRTEKEAIEAIQQFGKTMVKVEIFPSLEDLT